MINGSTKQAGPNGASEDYQPSQGRVAGARGEEEGKVVVQNERQNEQRRVGVEEKQKDECN